MSNGLAKLGRGLSWLGTLSLWMAGVGLVAMTLIVAWQVFCRYVLNDSPSWTEPGAVMLMSWFIFLGAAVGVRETIISASTCCSMWCRRAARSGCA